MQITAGAAERIKSLLETPGGRILQSLGQKITEEAVREVEIILLQHILDRLIVAKYGPQDVDVNDLAKLSEAAVEVRRRQEITGEPRCATVPQYVATFYHSGTAQMEAMMQLESLGLTALATPEGIEYLRRKFPPKD